MFHTEHDILKIDRIMKLQNFQGFLQHDRFYFNSMLHIHSFYEEFFLFTFYLMHYVFVFPNISAACFNEKRNIVEILDHELR